MKFLKINSDWGRVSLCLVLELASLIVGIHAFLDVQYKTSYEIGSNVIETGIAVMLLISATFIFKGED